MCQEIWSGYIPRLCPYDTSQPPP